MFFPLIPIAYLLLAALYLRIGRGWRECLLFAAVTWGILLVAITEALSFAHLITLGGIAVAWGLVILLAAGALFYLGLPDWDDGREPPDLPPRSVFLLIGAVAIIAILLGVVAIVGAPNTMDAMTYHLGRVIHWTQNQSLAFYATNIPRQLHMSPGAEFAVLHVQVLAGTDYLVNLVQWTAMVGSLIGVSLIARELGASARGQALAAAVCITIPMGILQSSTTQNDYAAAFWCVCFAYFVLMLRHPIDAKTVWLYCLAAAAALGLAMLTKATTYVFVAPFGLALAVILWRRQRQIFPLIVIVAIALMLNLGHYSRNMRLYHWPLGPATDAAVANQFTYTNGRFGVGVTVSNVLRNLALELTLPGQRAPLAVEHSVRTLHRWLRLNPEDPDSTWTAEPFRLLGFLWKHEDEAGNPAHVVLFIAALLTLLIVARRRPDSRPPLLYATGVVAGFVLFCAYLRWQPWHCRLHLPLLVLTSPLIAVVMDRFWNWIVSAALTMALLAGSMFWVLDSSSHPLLGEPSIFDIPRTSQYFIHLPGAEPYFKQFTEFARMNRPKVVGLNTNGDTPEYPIWLMLRAGYPPVRVEHVNVPNPSGALADPNLKVDATLTLGR